MMSFTTDRHIWSVSWLWKTLLWELNFTHWLISLRQPQARANLTTRRFFTRQMNKMFFQGRVSKTLGGVHGTDYGTDGSHRMCPLINGLTGAWQPMRRALGPPNHVWGPLSEAIVQKHRYIKHPQFLPSLCPCCCQLFSECRGWKETVVAGEL